MWVVRIPGTEQEGRNMFNSTIPSRVNAVLPSSSRDPSPRPAVPRKNVKVIRWERFYERQCADWGATPSYPPSYPPSSSFCPRFWKLSVLFFLPFPALDMRVVRISNTRSESSNKFNLTKSCKVNATLPSLNPNSSLWPAVPRKNVKDIWWERSFERQCAEWRATPSSPLHTVSPFSSLSVFVWDFENLQPLSLAIHVIAFDQVFSPEII